MADLCKFLTVQKVVQTHVRGRRHILLFPLDSPLPPKISLPQKSLHSRRNTEMHLDVNGRSHWWTLFLSQVETSYFRIELKRSQCNMWPSTGKRTLRAWSPVCWKHQPIQQLCHPFVRHIKLFKRLGHPFIKDIRLFKQLSRRYYGIPSRDLSYFLSNDMDHPFRETINTICYKKFTCSSSCFFQSSG